MKRVKGTYNGSAVVLQEKVELPPDTEVEVLIPEAREKGLPEGLDALDRTPVGELMSVQNRGLSPVWSVASVSPVPILAGIRGRRER